MAFVREEITSEEDRALFKSFNFINPVYDVPTTPRKWTIDRERNAFLAEVGGGGIEIPNFYAFVWNNNVIIFSLFENVRSTISGETEWTWDILKFLAPMCLAEYEKEIIDMIKEALVDSILAPEEKKRSYKYIFKFKTNPQYILEGDEYKTKDIFRGA